MTDYLKAVFAYVFRSQILTGHPICHPCLNNCAEFSAIPGNMVRDVVYKGSTTVLEYANIGDTFADIAHWSLQIHVGIPAGGRYANILSREAIFLDDSFLGSQLGLRIRSQSLESVS